MQSNIIINSCFSCIIGVLEFERILKQKINLQINIKSEKFLDYAKVLKFSKKYFKKKKFYTLEKAAKKLANKLKTKYPHIKKIKIIIIKTQIIANTKVGIKYKKKYKLK